MLQRPSKLSDDIESRKPRGQHFDYVTTEHHQIHLFFTAALQFGFQGKDLKKTTSNNYSGQFPWAHRCLKYIRNLDSSIMIYQTGSAEATRSKTDSNVRASIM
uniref:Uncharacterized protein n=1 Tax=Schistocephalus solidus TaxID=70667 RepID=A0A0X3NYW1_SCHSO